MSASITCSLSAGREIYVQAMSGTQKRDSKTDPGFSLDRSIASLGSRGSETSYECTGAKGVPSGGERNEQATTSIPTIRKNIFAT